MKRVVLMIIPALICGVVFTNCSTDKVQENQSTVSVSGIGTVLAQPDMVQMNINFSHIASTTREARRALDQTMQQILKILQEEKIEENYIKTISLNYDIAYDWRNGRMVRIGQRAQQTIVVTVNDIINSPERFPTILDKVTAINRVEVHNIRFDIENKTELFKQSRELAYQKAFEKASQYATLSNLKIGKVLTISEERSRDIVQVRAFMNNAAYEAQADEYSAGSSVPTGEREVVSEISITFLLE
jgi:uncharacterized protein YggE